MVELSEVVAMVIEDDRLNATLIKKMLLMAGVGEVSVCLSGFDTRKVAPDLPPVDLVLLDLQLPDEDGFQILVYLRTLPNMQNARYVAVTANVLASYLERAKAMNLDGFLGKPLKFDEFRKQIVSILEGRRVWDP
ncbi:MAG: response regulator [Anaerolineae bacterium]|nr:response regulator [Anaerolineae bacterium]